MTNKKWTNIANIVLLVQVFKWYIAVGTHMMSVAAFFLGITISLAAQAPKIWGGQLHRGGT